MLEVRVPKISSTVSDMTRSSTINEKPVEKRTIQLKRPTTTTKDDSKGILLSTKSVL